MICKCNKNIHIYIDVLILGIIITSRNIHGNKAVLNSIHFQQRNAGDASTNIYIIQNDPKQTAIRPKSLLRLEENKSSRNLGPLLPSHNITGLQKRWTNFELTKNMFVEIFERLALTTQDKCLNINLQKGIPNESELTHRHANIKRPIHIPTCESRDCSTIFSHPRNTG